MVDDSPYQRAQLSSLLKRAGLRVVGEAGDGLAAVSLYQELHPDVVLMDIVMPKLDGLRATRQILAADPQATVVMVSSMGLRSKVLEAIEAGAANFVVKPYDPAKLLDILGKVLQRRRQPARG